jgi:hypothetical protein
MSVRVAASTTRFNVFTVITVSSGNTVASRLNVFVDLANAPYSVSFTLVLPSRTDICGDTLRWPTLLSKRTI